MCNTFVEHGIIVELALPESGLSIEDTNEYICKRYGIKIAFKLLYYRARFKNSKLEKYLGYRSVKKILSKSNADYIFVRIPKFIKPVLSSGKKLIFESHNNILHNKIPFIDKYWKIIIKHHIYNENFALFISISHNLDNYWRQLGLPGSKLMALHDGFSAEKYAIVLDKSTVRRKLDIPINEKVAMYVGSLYPDREIENIINVAKRIPNIVFYIIGGPEKYRRYYLNMITNNNLLNVKLLGQVSHDLVPSYLFSADILLALWSRKVPTINYCSPLKIFEYMASKRTIVAHDFITIREVLENGKDALLVDPDDPEHLYQTIKNIVKDKPNNLGKSAREKAFKKYTWQHRTNQIIKRISR